MPNINQQTFLETIDESYAAMVDDWVFWEDSFIGGSRYNTRGHLLQHPRERTESFNYRLKHAVYRNYTRDVCEDWNSKLFGPGFAVSLDKPDATGPRAEIISVWEDDFDLVGSEIYSFLFDASLQACALGTVGIVVQVLNEYGDDVSRLVAEQNPDKVRPYATIIPPWNITRFGFDRYKRLEWVLIRESTTLEKGYDEISTSNPLFTKNSGSVWRYYYIDRDEIVVFEPTDRGVWSEEHIPHDLGYLPFVTVSWDKPDKGSIFSRPPTEEISLFGKLIYNLRNGVVEMSESQMFSILVMSGRASPKSGEGDGDKDDGGAFEVGHSRGLMAPIGSDFPPHFISPDAQLQKVQREFIADLERAIMQTAREGGYSLVDTGRTRDASGRAKAFDIDKLTSFLRKSGRCLSSSFERILTIYWNRSIFGDEEFEGYIKFPEDFHLRGSIELAEEALALDRAIQESETARKVIRRRFVRAALAQDMTDDEKKAIAKEIAEAEFMLEPLGNSGSDETGNTRGLATQESSKEESDARTGTRFDDRQVPGEKGTGEQTGPSNRRTPRRRRQSVGVG